jgi:hypothetical protein
VFRRTALPRRTTTSTTGLFSLSWNEPAAVATKADAGETVIVKRANPIMTARTMRASIAEPRGRTEVIIDDCISSPFHFTRSVIDLRNKVKSAPLPYWIASLSKLLCPVSRQPQIVCQSERIWGAATSRARQQTCLLAQPSKRVADQSIICIKRMQLYLTIKFKPWWKAFRPFSASARP